MHGPSGGGGGIESLTPRTSVLTSMLVLLGFGLAIRMAVKHPRILPSVFGAAIVITLLGGGDNPVAHPWLGLAAIIIGFCLCPAPTPQPAKDETK